MSRFNTSAKYKTITTNHEGAKAYTLTPELELYSLVCTFGLSNKFYESESSQMDRLKSLIKSVSPKFVAKLAIYAREQMYLRTVPLILTVELAKIHKGDSLVSKLVQRVVQRADEINELLACYQYANNKSGTKKLNKLSKQIQKGIKHVFESGKFTEYHFQKYNRKTDIRFRDALFLTHPKPSNDEQEKLFNNIANDTMPIPVTWETQMSEAGKMDSPITSKKTVWEDLIDNKKLGYMATLKNLRNFLKEGVSADHIKKVCDYLTNVEAVKNSKQLPFRFLAAYRMLLGMTPLGYMGTLSNKTETFPFIDLVLSALERAVQLSIVNMSEFFNDQNVLIAADVSASMIRPVSCKSIITTYDIGTMLSMMVNKITKNSITGIFGDSWAIKDFPNDCILYNTNKLYDIEGEVGYSTNGYKVIKWALESDKKFDKIMIFTDCQLWNSLRNSKDIQTYWNKYHKKNPNTKLYLFDLQGYGTSPLNLLDKNVYLISGWSEKIFDVMSKIENGGQTLDNINNIEL